MTEYNETEETETSSKVCIASGGKCVCGGRHIQLDDYCDPLCGLPILGLFKKEEEDENV